MISVCAKNKRDIALKSPKFEPKFPLISTMRKHTSNVAVNVDRSEDNTLTSNRSDDSTAVYYVNNAKRAFVNENLSS